MAWRDIASVMKCGAMYGHKMRGRGAHPMCMRVTGRVWLDPAAFGMVFLLPKPMPKEPDVEPAPV
jgi:hypothetical protein